MVTSEMNKFIETNLRMLGLNKSYKGFNYLICAVNLVLEDSDILTYICKGLYVEIALQYDTSVASVERNIRTARKVIWNNGDKITLNSIFGSMYQQSMPGNAVFIDKLTYYIKTLSEE